MKLKKNAIMIDRCFFKTERGWRLVSYDFLLTIAIILLFTKIFGLTSERVHMPQVVGALVAGVILGPTCLGLVGGE